MGATDHITRELEKLDVRTKYNGAYQVHTASGAGMNISHIEHSIISTHVCDLVLKNILHVPEAGKNLLSVHHFTFDNHTYLEYFSNFFLVKDLKMRRPLLKGWCHHGLYPLPSKVMRRHALGGSKSSFARWQNRLGHPSSSIVRKVVSEYNLPLSSETISELVCDSCQQGKSHQLSYSTSHSISCILHLIVYHLSLFNLFTWTCWVLHQIPWWVRSIMLASLMTTANALGFTC
jgi:hypothetical protein